MAGQPTAFLDSDKVRGIDVSHFQASVSWKKVAAAGIRFAFVKATEGVGLIDTHFADNYAAAKDNGILRGAYHFFHPKSDPVAQATSFLHVVPSLDKGDLPVVLDVEVDEGKSANVIVGGIQKWMDTVEAALKRPVLLYTRASFWKDKVGNSQRFVDRPLFIAHYTAKPKPTLPTGYKSFQFWQFSEQGKVAGITTNVDLDRFNGTLDQLRALAGL